MTGRTRITYRTQKKMAAKSLNLKAIFLSLFLYRLLANPVLELLL